MGTIPQVVKPRRSNKAPAVKAAVLIRRANGTPKRQIAREMGISRPTVDVIIKEANLDQQLEAGQIQSAQLIPEAIRVAKVRLSKDSENMAIKVLENTIWPLQAKQSRGLGDMQLNLAIQTLIQQGQSTSQITVDTTDKLPEQLPAALALPALDSTKP